MELRDQIVQYLTKEFAMEPANATDIANKAIVFIRTTADSELVIPQYEIRYLPGPAPMSDFEQLHNHYRTLNTLTDILEKQQGFLLAATDEQQRRILRTEFLDIRGKFIAILTEIDQMFQRYSQK